MYLWCWGMNPGSQECLRKHLTTLLHKALLNLLESQFPTRKWNNNSNLHDLYEHQKRDDTQICPLTTGILIEMLMSVIGITITFDKTVIPVHI